MMKSSLVARSLPALTDVNGWRNVIAEVITQAMQAGASAAEASVGSHKGFQLNVRHGNVETLEFTRDTGLGLTVYLGQKSGSVSITELHSAAITEAIAKAKAIAQFTGDDPFAGLAEPQFLAHQYPELDLYHPWDITPEQAIVMAQTCEAEALSQDNRLTNSDGASVATSQNVHAYANSNGFNGGYCTTSHSISCSLIAEQAGKMQSNGDYTAALDAADLINLSQLARQAAERTVSRLGARSVPTGRYPVIFRAEIARSLVGHCLQAISGGSIYRRASFLVDMLGQPICSSHIEISENPLLPKGVGSAPFDQEGVVTKQRKLVEQGVLQSYILNSYSGRQLGMPTTGNAGGVRNVQIKTSDKSLSDLLKAMGTGLLITEVMGQGVNIVTGDYSRGASGFWIENGEIAYPVEEITIAANLKDMLKQVVAIGNDVDKRSNIQSGSIWLEQMTVAGRV
jgi:PmbA protein